MDLYAVGNAVEIRYPTGQLDAQHLAEEFAARLDDLVDVSTSPFTAMVGAGVPTTDIEAIYIGREQDWAAEVGLANIPWWAEGNDFAVKVVSGSDCLNVACTGSELHIVARDYPLLLRAAWMALHGLGWRHYMPNGVEDLEDLWVSINKRDTITTNVDRVWTGAIDHLLPNIAAGTSNLGWSDGTDHGLLRDGDGNILYPNGLREGNLSGAIGESPTIEPDPDGTWLRHMGWTTSSSLQTNAAWTAVINYDETHGQIAGLAQHAIELPGRQGRGPRDDVVDRLGEGQRQRRGGQREESIGQEALDPAGHRHREGRLQDGASDQRRRLHSP